MGEQTDSKGTKSDVYSRAARLGQDLEVLRAGREVVTRMQVEHVDALRKLLGSDEDSSRLARQGPVPRSGPVGFSDRVLNYLHGTDELSNADKELAMQRFPIEVEVLSAQNKTLQPGEHWDLGTSGSLKIVNLGTLTMGAGSYISIQNNALEFACDTLVKQ